MPKKEKKIPFEVVLKKAEGFLLSTGEMVADEKIAIRKELEEIFKKWYPNGHLFYWKSSCISAKGVLDYLVRNRGELLDFLQRLIDTDSVEGGGEEND